MTIELIDRIKALRDRAIKSGYRPDEETFQCHVCKDIGFVKGHDIHRHGQVYETVKLCDREGCPIAEPVLRAAKIKRAKRAIKASRERTEVEKFDEDTATRSSSGFKQGGFSYGEK